MIYKAMTEIKDQISEVRRYLHQYPEASMKEYKTAEYVRAYLDKLGIKWVEAGETGTVGIIEGNGNKGIVGLRGDIDALEMTELNACEYASKNPGLMHACGHDGHTAALLFAAEYLNQHREELPGTVKLIFQPGEENGLGAKSVVDSGNLGEVDAVFGLHVSTSIPIGKVTIKSGPMSAANEKFKIWIKGKGAHGSVPQKGADALIAGAALVSALQNVICRESDPLKPTVMTIGIFESGTAFNILPEDAYIEGSIRVLEEEQRYVNREAIKRMAESVAVAYKCKATTEFINTAKVVYNDEALTDLARKSAARILGEESVGEQEMSLGAEDFGEFVEIAPVTYMNIGCRNEELGITAAHHHGNFEIDEDCLPICAAMYAQFVYDYFEM